MRIVQIKLWRRTKWFFGNSLTEKDGHFFTQLFKKKFWTPIIHNTFVHNWWFETNCFQLFLKNDFKTPNEESLNMDSSYFSSNSSRKRMESTSFWRPLVCKTGHQLFLTVFPTSINIPSEYKTSTEKGYPLEETKQSPYAALAFAAASFAGVMSIGTHY